MTTTGKITYYMIVIFICKRQKTVLEVLCLCWIWYGTYAPALFFIQLDLVSWLLLYWVKSCLKCIWNHHRFNYRFPSIHLFQTASSQNLYHCVIVMKPFNKSFCQTCLNASCSCAPCFKMYCLAKIEYSQSTHQDLCLLS